MDFNMAGPVLALAILQLGVVSVAIRRISFTRCDEHH